MAADVTLAEVEEARNAYVSKLTALGHHMSAETFNEAIRRKQRADWDYTADLRERDARLARLRLEQAQERYAAQEAARRRKVDEDLARSNRTVARAALGVSVIAAITSAGQLYLRWCEVRGR